MFSVYGDRTLSVVPLIGTDVLHLFSSFTRAIGLAQENASSCFCHCVSDAHQRRHRSPVRITTNQICYPADPSSL